METIKVTENTSTITDTRQWFENNVPNFSTVAKCVLLDAPTVTYQCIVLFNDLFWSGSNHGGVRAGQSRATEWGTFTGDSGTGTLKLVEGTEYIIIRKQ